MDIMDVLLSAKLNKNSDGSSGTTNYNQLTNKPKINNIELSGNKTLTDLGIAARSDIPEIPVSDVQIDGTSILSNGVANIPIGSQNDLGLVKQAGLGYSVAIGSDGTLAVVGADTATIKGGNQNSKRPIVPSLTHVAAFYGLAKAAGDTTQAQSENAVGTYTNEAKSAIRTMLGAGDVDDVQINGTSILSNGVANIPIASNITPGAVKVNGGYGIALSNGTLRINEATDGLIKQGNDPDYPIVSKNAHTASFYGLAKAAGDSTQSASANAVGTYTEEAKNAIRAMLGVTDSAGGMNVVILTGTNITQTAAENTMYKCGELAELTFTAPASGITAVRFSSGSTPTVASFPGVTWLGDFDPDNLIANVTYEINIFDGVGVAGWA